MTNLPGSWSGYTAGSPVTSCTPGTSVGGTYTTHLPRESTTGSSSSGTGLENDTRAVLIELHGRIETGETVFDRETYEKCIRNTGTEIVAIWCNADIFFTKIENPEPHFCTGMFISEVSEAKTYMIEESEEKINEQFELFSKLLSDIFDSPIENYFDYLNEHYTGDSPVIEFNREEMLFD